MMLDLAGHVLGNGIFDASCKHFNATVVNLTLMSALKLLKQCVEKLRAIDLQLQQTSASFSKDFSERMPEVEQKYQALFYWLLVYKVTLETYVYKKKDVDMCLSMNARRLAFKKVIPGAKHALLTGLIKELLDNLRQLPAVGVALDPPVANSPTEMPMKKQAVQALPQASVFARSADEGCASGSASAPAADRKSAVDKSDEAQKLLQRLIGRFKRLKDDDSIDEDMKSKWKSQLESLLRSPDISSITRLNDELCQKLQEVESSASSPCKRG